MGNRKPGRVAIRKLAGELRQRAVDQGAVLIGDVEALVLEMWETNRAEYERLASEVSA